MILKNHNTISSCLWLQPFFIVAGQSFYIWHSRVHFLNKKIFDFDIFTIIKGTITVDTDKKMRILEVFG
jgi:predicted small integral membrane protein